VLGGLYLSFCPITLQLWFQVLVSMQMDAEVRKVGTPFVWLGALEGGFGGWVVFQGCHAFQKNRKTPSCLRPWYYTGMLLMLNNLRVKMSKHLKLAFRTLSC
jgi:hypothetical protein